MINREQHIAIFYDLLKKVIEKFPLQTLNNLGSVELPSQGVYFFFEEGETRNNKTDSRVVRIGTHAAVANSKASLYDRLYNHKGYKDLSGNHRGSVFRKLIGLSLTNRDKLDYKYWGDKSKKKDSIVKLSEKPLEMIVSQYLNKMPFTVLEVNGPSSKTNARALIEENSIALLSNFNKTPIDFHSPEWLGIYSKVDKVISSGLWNSDYVDQNYIAANYFEVFEYHLSIMKNYFS